MVLVRGDWILCSGPVSHLVVGEENLMAKDMEEGLEIMTDLIRHNVDLICRVARMEQALKMIQLRAHVQAGFCTTCTFEFEYLEEKAKEALEDGKRIID